MVISTALFDKPAWKNLVVNGIVLAADGQKMSKSKGNFPPPQKVFDSYGADAVRLYLCNSPVVRAESLAFKEEGVLDVIKDVLSPWWNVYKFFVENARRYENETGNTFQYNPNIHTSVQNVMDMLVSVFFFHFFLFFYFSFIIFIFNSSILYFVFCSLYAALFQIGENRGFRKNLFFFLMNFKGFDFLFRMHKWEQHDRQSACNCCLKSFLVCDHCYKRKHNCKHQYKHKQNETKKQNVWCRAWFCIFLFFYFFFNKKTDGYYRNYNL